MLRFAASPTRDMHIGDLRVALLNYIASQQRKEDFIVRVEDAKKAKNIEGKDQEILDLLALFGIEYTQLIYQSENVRFHTAMALQLLHEKKAFSCFCSPNWISNKQEEAKAAKKPYYYDDACRNLPAELVIDNTNPFTIRVTRPDTDVVIHDYAKGDVSFTADAVDSFMIMNQDKTPTYNFSCGVDDMLNDISLIICEEEEIENIAKQEHIRASLNYDKKIKYAHLAKIANDDSIGIKWLLEEGYLPAAISNYLISSVNKAPQKIFETKDAVEWLDLKNIFNSPTSFDIEKLKEINKEHLLALDTKELSRYVGFADEEIGELARIYLEDVQTTKELREKIEAIFAPKVIPEAYVSQADIISKLVKSAPYFEEYDSFKNYILKESNLSEEDFSKTLRLLLTAVEDGPDLAKVYKYLKNYLGEIIK